MTPLAAPVAYALSAVLSLIAALHVLWGIGVWLPLRDEAALTRAVVGARGRVRMPGAVPCALVAVALMGAVSVIWWVPGLPRTLALWVLALVFALRGVASQTTAWRRMLPEEPFATLDRRGYGPLCLGLAAGFATLAATG